MRIVELHADARTGAATFGIVTQRMKILFLTQWFEPEPTFKGLLFARELAARGHEVEVLTGFPNYPGGKVYPGYRIRPWVREQIDGIDMLRVALYPSHNNSGLHRALNYLSFALSAAVIGTALIRKPDVVYVYHPPITVGFAATVIGFFRRTPFVYDIQDLWPDTVAASGMMSNPAALALLGKLCNFVYRRARHITVLSPGFKEQLVGRGVPPDKIDVIYNWCDEKALKPRPQICNAIGRNGSFFHSLCRHDGACPGHRQRASRRANLSDYGTGRRVPLYWRWGRSAPLGEYG